MNDLIQDRIDKEEKKESFKSKFEERVEIINTLEHTVKQEGVLVYDSALFTNLENYEVR